MTQITAKEYNVLNEFNIYQFGPLLNTCSVQLTYFGLPVCYQNKTTF